MVLSKVQLNYFEHLIMDCLDKNQPAEDAENKNLQSEKNETPDQDSLLLHEMQTHQIQS